MTVRWWWSPSTKVLWEKSTTLWASMQVLCESLEMNESLDAHTRRTARIILKRLKEES